MERTMTEELDWAGKMVVSVFGERNPDVVADTVSRYWHGISYRGWKRCLMRLKWAWLQEVTGRPFLGSGEGSGHSDVFRRRRESVQDIPRREAAASPDWPVLVKEMGQWIEQHARCRMERLAIRAIRRGVNFAEAAREASVSIDSVRGGYYRLRARCRRIAPDCIG